jgi:DNA polymerase-3 subunit gamma/tau
MSYLVYARKYRPQNFDKVIGQKAVVQTLKNAIQNQRVAQAYIFSGMRGVGKTTAARILAKALNCQEGPTPTPCNVCDFCLEINEDRSVDVIEIDGASTTGVDNVRSLREGLQYKPIRCRTKVIIIDEIHMLSTPAFNALLKTLEEPPPNTVFIFATTEFHQVPATIVSRCQHFEFKRIAHAEIIRHLRHVAEQEKITITDPGLHLIAHSAEGSLRDAQSLLDQAVAFSGDQVNDDDLKEILGTINRDLLFQCSNAVLNERPEAIFPLIEKVINSGYDLRFFHTELIQHFRDLLLIRSVKDPQELLPHTSEDLLALRDAAASASPQDLLRYLLSLQQGEQGLKFSSHPRIYLESMLVKLCHYSKLKPVQDLLKQIESCKNDAPVREQGEPAKKNVPCLNSAPAVSKPDPAPASPKKSTPLPPAGPKADPQPSPSPAPARTPKKDLLQMDPALDDPAVQNFMQTFKAQILSVERKKGEKIATKDIKDLVE